MLVKATITVAANTVAAPDGNDKQIMLTNWDLHTDCICKISNTQEDNAKDIDVKMQTYNLIQW